VEKEDVIEALKQRYNTDIFDVDFQEKNASILIQTAYGFVAITNLISADCIDISTFTNKSECPKVSFWSSKTKTFESKSTKGLEDVIVISGHPLD